MNLALSVVQNKPRLDVRVKDEVKFSAATPAKARPRCRAGLVQVVQLEGAGNSSVNQAGIELTTPTMTGHLVQAGKLRAPQGDLGTATYRLGNYAGLQLHSSDGRVLLEQSLRGTDFSRGLLQFNKVRGDGLQTPGNQTRSGSR